MFGLALNVQYFILIKCIGLGFMFAFIFCIFSLIPIRNIYIRALADILFFVSAAVVTFIFCLEYNFGKGRVFILIGEASGWGLFYCFPFTVINYFIKKIKFLIKNQKKVLKKKD